MVIHIINKLSYENVTIELDNDNYTMHWDECIDVQTEANFHQMTIKVPETSNHYFDLPALLTFSFGRKSSWCDIYCISTLKFNMTDEKTTVILNDNNYQHNKRYNYKATSFVTTDSQITETHYYPTDTALVKKKHAIYNLLVPMLSPILVIDVILFCIYNNFKLLFAAFFCFFVFTLPGFMDIIKFNKTCENRTDIEKLLIANGAKENCH